MNKISTRVIKTLLGQMEQLGIIEDYCVSNENSNVNIDVIIKPKKAADFVYIPITIGKPTP